MPISNYPRRGHPIAPQTLYSLLEVPIPSYARPSKLSGSIKLCDLDASVWQSIEPEEAAVLGIAVLSRVEHSRRDLLEHLADVHLPTPPIDSTLDDLELEVRTYNRLKSQWPECECDLQQLGQKTIGQTMELPTFGVKSLVDLLSSLEALNESVAGTLFSASSIFTEPDAATAHFENNITHDARIGLLLSETDDAAHKLREAMHRIAWLLNSSYDEEVGAQEIAQVWQALDGLMQCASQLEKLTTQVEPGHALPPLLDEELSRVAKEFFVLPDFSLNRMTCDCRPC